MIVTAKILMYLIVFIIGYFMFSYALRRSEEEKSCKKVKNVKLHEGRQDKTRSYRGSLKYKGDEILSFKFESECNNK